MMTNTARKPCVMGNWKMHGNHASIAALMQVFTQKIPKLEHHEKISIVVCPPFPYLQQVHRILEQTLEHTPNVASPIALGAQNVYCESEGPFTGEVSSGMLVDLNCQYVIIGHSERRQLFKETDALIARKFRAAYDAGLIPILCVGETEAERRAGETLDVVSRQLKAVLDEMGHKPFSRALIAYEPVWAIGTGLTATPKEAAEVHAFLRAQFETAPDDLSNKVRILYGGSVKANNAADLFREQDIDGALVGGASLNGEEFLTICRLAISSVL